MVKSVSVAVSVSKTDSHLGEEAAKGWYVAPASLLFSDDLQNSAGDVIHLLGGHAGKYGQAQDALAGAFGIWKCSGGIRSGFRK